MQLAIPAAAAAVLLVKHLRAGPQRRKRLEAALDEYREVFDVPATQLHALRDALVEQMEAGLAGKGGLMMLPSYVDVLPSGDEAGDCFAVDLGGTNLRVAHVRLGQARGQVEAVHISEWPVPEEHFDVDRGSLLRFVAARTAEVVQRHAGGEPRPVIGFCFSFPVEQTALDNGKVLVWTKNFRGRHLVGSDVVAALRVELAAEGLPGAVVPAVMNDTVATLVALRYSEPAAQLGIILGTGTNCAYLESAAAVGKLAPGYVPRTPAMVVNTEWGDLRGGALPACLEDLWVDCSSPHPGAAAFEKRVSGLYLGELARRVLLRLAEREGLFGGTVPGLLARHHCFTAAHVAAADEDDSPGLEGVAAVLREALHIEAASRRQRGVVQEVCRLVSLRSARLCAAAIAGVLRRMGHPAGGGGGGGAPPPRVVVAVDGSVFAKYAKYRQRLGEALAEVCGEAAAAVELRHAKDGSVLGAAFLAAAAAAFDAQRRPAS